MGSSVRTTSAEDEMVSLLVPRRYYPTVVSALARAMEAAGEHHSAPGKVSDAGESAGSQDTGRPWAREEVRQLKQRVQNKTVRTLLDMTSEQPGEWVSIRDLEQRSQRTYGQTRGDLAGFTRMVRSKFNHEQWPITFGWAVDGKPQASYRMSEDVARWWNEE